MPSKLDLYDKDFFAWSGQQAALLRAGQFNAADIEHIAEEIESMGNTEKRELVSRLKVLLLHLLKWQFQSPGRGSSWETSIKIRRLELVDHLSDNPSLKSKLSEAISSAYRIAVVAASGETGMPETTFSENCPYSFQQMMSRSFWPGA